MSFTRAQTRALLYRLVPGLGFAGTADSYGDNDLIDTFLLEDSEAAASQFYGAYIYRPSLSTDDRIKPAGDLDGSTGQLNHTGTAYSDKTAGGAYEVVGLMHPDELDKCIQRGMRRIFFETYVPLGLWTDNDFSLDSNAAHFTPQDHNVTSSKSASSDYNKTGFYSLLVTGDGAHTDGYTRTEAATVSPGDVLFHGGLNRVAGAHTVSYKLWDLTNDVEINSSFAVSHSEYKWQHVFRVDTIPDGCYQVAAQLGISGANDVGIWDCLFGHVLGSRRFDAPSWADEPFKVLSVEEAIYGRSPATGRHLADERRYKTWFNPSEWELEPLTEEVASRTITVTRPERELPQHDLWLHGKRYYADIAAMDNETDATNAPEDLLIAACLVEVATLLNLRYPAEQQWVTMRTDNEAKLHAQRAARPPVKPRRGFEHYTPGGRA